MGVFLFILAILTVVMIHEAGHFLTAKLFGFKATKFFVGFGPPIWSFKRGETEYGIAAIPAGGFVKIVGMNPYEDVAPEDEPRSYPNKPIWQRAIVLVAGSATHWPVAFVLLVIASMFVGFPTDRATNEVAVVEREVNGQPAPAAVAGFKPGDTIVEVDGRATPTWEEVRNAIRGRADEDTTFTVLRNGERESREVRLGTATFTQEGELCEYIGPGTQGGTSDTADCGSGSETVGFLGVQPQPEFETKGFFGAVAASASRLAEITWLSVRGIGEVFGMVFGGELWDALTGSGSRAVDEGPLGLVGAGRIASETVARGEFLNFIGLIVGFTVFVGLMNLLPLPPLDGGHLAVLVWEKVTGKRVDMRRLIPIAAAVIAFFVVLFIAVLYLDIARPVRVPF